MNEGNQHWVSLYLNVCVNVPQLCLCCQCNHNDNLSLLWADSQCFLPLLINWGIPLSFLVHSPGCPVCYRAVSYLSAFAWNRQKCVSNKTNIQYSTQVNVWFATLYRMTDLKSIVFVAIIYETGLCLYCRIKLIKFEMWCLISLLFGLPMSSLQ